MLYTQAYAGSCHWELLSCESCFAKYCFSLCHHWLTHRHKVEYLVDEAYIDKEDQGDLIAMTPTIVDMLGVFFLKVPSSSLLTEKCSASKSGLRRYSCQSGKPFHTSSPQASSYEFMAESSRQGSTAYWFSPPDINLSINLSKHLKGRFGETCLYCPYYIKE